MTLWKTILIIVVAGIIVVPWMYVVARVITRGILRTLDEHKRRK